MQDELGDKGVSHSMVLSSQFVIEERGLGLAAVVINRLSSLLIIGIGSRIILLVIILDIHGRLCPPLLIVLLVTLRNMSLEKVILLVHRRIPLLEFLLK